MEKNMSERQKCDCCESDLSFQWSDTHGVGVCFNCGLPYTIYHYENDQRVDKPPVVALSDEGLQIAKRYWSEKKRRVFPAAYDMGFLGGRGTSYSGATRSDCAAFGEWYEANYPKQEQASA
jgi:hypothetical protein